MQYKKNQEYTIKQLEPIIRIAELNRELGLKLLLIKERAEQNKKDMESLLSLARQLSNLKHQFHDDFKEIENLTKAEKEYINRLFRNKYIQGVRI